MNIWQSLFGAVRVRILTGSPDQLLNRIYNAEINIMQVLLLDDVSIEVTILRRDIQKVKSFAEKSGASFKIVKNLGIYWNLIGLRKRKFLLLSILILVLLTLYIPSKILFVQVEGNQKIPANYIIDVVDTCGISFGADRRNVRSEKVKNALLEKIPELQWAGVNTYGCEAVVSVREKSMTVNDDKLMPVSNVIATQDGVIEQCTVMRGNSLCKVGQTVKKGQVLVSGYIDCGRFTKAVRAEAEIYARTLRKTEVILPTNCSQRVVLTDSKTSYSIICGKNIIKLSQDSGILPAECVKIYELKYMTLPGGFILPLALVIESYKNAEFTSKRLEAESANVWVIDFSEKYIKDHMIAGQIISSDHNLISEVGCLRLSGKYICSEMIGQIKSEEIIQHNGKND